MSNIPDLFRPEDFKLSEPPPPVLYKYMVADRVADVLDGGMVRFTHLLDTNDSFEVRKTFRRFAGPKFIELMKGAALAAITPAYIDQHIQQKLDEAGLNIPVAHVREMLKEQSGMSIEEFMRSQMGGFINMFASGLDSIKSPEEFLTEMGSILLCFSLSERYDIPAMWAHYGGNHTGLVVAFDTNHPWFKDDKSPAESKLQKIKYLDGQNDELFDDLQAAFSSKATDWAYEREWRVNCAMKQIEKTVDLGADTINLRSFPPGAVTTVIVGAKASDETVNRVRYVLKRKYPHAKLQRTTPQRMTGTFVLEDI
ncbi:DUF2971 domain-containing protein [Mesorhizobium sp. BR1-1-13]|uniref:DUF2971 domain-containing protein n=1 Tax=Mesorhizobium sp. BR1-1-13 TaxID=2876656 RepID=UPI001CD05D33|nr:DUF2971 domain-containing protein [Mesorhizobium sp. BR1-1-13]MBZ9940167.1 DUF2971 domain-containing protein [Mesorhizobium sp. BR1-1-13]